MRRARKRASRHSLTQIQLLRLPGLTDAIVTDVGRSTRDALPVNFTSPGGSSLLIGQSPERAHANYASVGVSFFMGNAARSRG